jgi:hypothetical protein
MLSRKQTRSEPPYLRSSGKLLDGKPLMRCTSCTAATIAVSNLADVPWQMNHVT